MNATPKAYYNEFDPKAAAWLRELIRRGLIADGDVDERSITDVNADDLAGYGQRHFFAGIGGWSLALRLAGVPDAAPVWTGSCPCQPFSCAGKAGGVGDERHLWPAFHRLIAECRPSVVFGEQVASKDGRLWLAGVRADLERCGYAVGAANLCAAGVGAPHIRQRLYWVAQSRCDEVRRGAGRREEVSWLPCAETARSSDAAQRGERRCGTGYDAGSEGISGIRHTGACTTTMRTNTGLANFAASTNSAPTAQFAKTGSDRLANAPLGGLGAGGGAPGQPGHADQCGAAGGAGQPGAIGREGQQSAGAAPRTTFGACAAWSNSTWLPCRDGKARRVESGLAPLAHGVPARVVRLRGYGNAIVPPLAAEFVMAAMEAVEESQ